MDRHSKTNPIVQNKESLQAQTSTIKPGQRSQVQLVVTVLAVEITKMVSKHDGNLNH